MVMGPYRQALADLGVLQFAVQPLDQLLKQLVQSHQIYDVMVEAGATLSTAFLQEKLVDELTKKWKKWTWIQNGITTLNICVFDSFI